MAAVAVVAVRFPAQSLAVVAAVAVAALAVLGRPLVARADFRLLQQTALAAKASPGVLPYRPQATLNLAAVAVRALLQPLSPPPSAADQSTAVVAAVRVVRTARRLRTWLVVRVVHPTATPQVAVVHMEQMAHRQPLALLALMAIRPRAGLAVEVAARLSRLRPLVLPVALADVVAVEVAAVALG